MDEYFRCTYLIIIGMKNDKNTFKHQIIFLAFRQLQNY